MARQDVGRSQTKRWWHYVAKTADVWKTTLGSVVVWEVARLTGSRHPYLAPLTFILCLQATVGQSVRYALYRSAGTVIGVFLIGAFAKWIPITAWALGIALLLTTVLMKCFRANAMLTHQVALSVLFVMYFEQHSSGYAWDRAKDTLIGAIVGVAFVVLLFPPSPLNQIRQAMDALGQHFVDALHHVAEYPVDELREGELNQVVMALLDGMQSVAESLHTAKQDAPWLLYTKKVHIQRLDETFSLFREVCVHFVVFSERFAGPMSPEQRERWRGQLRRLAKQLSITLGDKAHVPSFNFASNLPQHDALHQALERLVRAFRCANDA
ncbi:FUSC family protein [Alicyclobacillus suci]|uniref:FUSC family protein n=1 Tax=Alicyclobacillus suci TaxID=2816080 RepID=UPI001A8C2A9E|nr:FUSC family protein [Alicyclobacillus suci]